MNVESMRSIQASFLTSTKDLEIASRKTTHLLSQTRAGCKRGRLRARIATSPWADHARLRASSGLPNPAQRAFTSSQTSITKASFFKSGIGPSRTASNTNAVHLKTCSQERKEARTAIRRNGGNGSGTSNINAIFGVVKTERVCCCLAEEQDSFLTAVSRKLGMGVLSPSAGTVPSHRKPFLRRRSTRNMAVVQSIGK
jgi:hypothetical protein